MPPTSRPVIVFAHGAGAPSTHPWMEGWAARLAAFGDVRRFDYPYMEAGRKAPDRLPKLMDRHRAVIDEARADGRPLVLAGKSMGSRVGCHVADDVAADAVVCFGYPLVSIRGAVRDEVLLALRTPILFVSGDRDRLCPLDALAGVRPRMEAPNELHVVRGGDHSLMLRKRDLKAWETTQEASDEEAASAVGAFLRTRLAP